MFLYQSVCFISVLRKITFITFVSLKPAINVNLFFLANSRPVPPPLSRGRFLHLSVFHTHMVGEKEGKGEGNQIRAPSVVVDGFVGHLTPRCQINAAGGR